MQSTPMPAALGHGGWLALLAFVVGLVVRLLKADRLEPLLVRWGLPSIPKKALPWLAIGLGLLGGVLEAKLGGATWEAASLAGAWGMVSGGAAVAGNESLAPIVRALAPGLADLVFGRHAGPGEPRSDGPKTEPPS